MIGVSGHNFKVGVYNRQLCLVGHEEPASHPL
jgi:hypothetical protein